MDERDYVRWREAVDYGGEDTRREGGRGSEDGSVGWRKETL